MARTATANGKTFTFDDNVTDEQISQAIEEYFKGEIQQPKNSAPDVKKKETADLKSEGSLSQSPVSNGQSKSASPSSETSSAEKRVVNPENKPIMTTFAPKPAGKVWENPFAGFKPQKQPSPQQEPQQQKQQKPNPQNKPVEGIGTPIKQKENSLISIYTPAAKKQDESDISFTPQNIVSAMTDEQLVNSDNQTIKMVISEKKGAEQSLFEQSALKNNPAQKFQQEAQLLGTRIQELNKRADDYYSLLQKKYGNGFQVTKSPTGEISASIPNENDPDFDAFTRIIQKASELKSQSRELINQPEFEDFRKVLDENKKEQQEIDEKYAKFKEKGIFGKAFDVIKGIATMGSPLTTALAEKTDAFDSYTGTMLRDNGWKYLSRTLLALASTPKMLENANPVGDADKYDMWDGLFDKASYLKKKTDLRNPTSSNADRDILTKYADVDGYKVTLDENGNVKDVRDKNFLTVKDEGVVSQIAQKYEGDKSAYPTKKDIGIESMAQKTIPVLQDMGTILAVSAMTGGGATTTMAVSAAQMYNGLYESFLDGGLSPKDANDAATAASIAMGYVTSKFNKMETNIAKKVAGKGVGKLVGKGLTRADVDLIQTGKMSPVELGKRLGTQYVKNTVGENIEELVLEPAVQKVVEIAYNEKAKDFGVGFVDANKPFFDTKETIETALITSATTLVMTPVEISNSLPDQRRVALQRAFDNPEFFKSLRKESVDNGLQSPHEYEAEMKIFDDVQKQYDASKRMVKGEDGQAKLAELLLRKHNLKIQMKDIGDDILNKKNKEVLEGINSELEMLVGVNMQEPEVQSQGNESQQDKAERESLEDVGDAEYKAFVDSGTVAPERLNSIAEKVKAGTPLSEKENAIFTDKTAEINDIIKKGVAPESATAQAATSPQENQTTKNTDGKENATTPTESTDTGQEQNVSTGFQQSDSNSGEVQQGDGTAAETGQQPEVEQQQAEPQQKVDKKQKAASLIQQLGLPKKQKAAEVKPEPTPTQQPMSPESTDVQDMSKKEEEIDKGKSTWQQEQDIIDSDAALTPMQKQEKKVEVTAKALEELDDRDLRDARRKTYDADAKGYTAFALDAFKDNHFGKYVKPLMYKYLSSIGLDYEKYKNLSETEKRKIDEGWRNSDFYKEAQNPVYEKRASTEYVAEQYHKAKADDSNPQLVEAVEKLLNDNSTTNAVNQPVQQDAATAEQQGGKEAVQQSPDATGQGNAEAAVADVESEDLDYELANNKTQVPEGKGSWRKTFNNTKDAMRKKDILRAIADISTDVNELKDITEATKGLPEGLQPEINYAVEYKLKSIRNKEALNTKPSPKSETTEVRFTESKDMNRMFAELKSKHGDKKGAAIYEAANRLVNPNTNTIVEIRSNGVVVKEGDRYIMKPFGNTDANSKKWTLYKGIDVTDQFVEQKPASKTESVEKTAEISPNKKVSASKSAAIKDLITKTKTYSDLTEMEAGILANLEGDEIIDDLFEWIPFNKKTKKGGGLKAKGMKGANILKLSEKGYIDEPYFSDDVIQLSEKGKQFKESLKARQETRKGIKEGTDLFPNDANLQQSSSNFQTITKAAFDNLMEKLKKAFPNVKVFSDEKTLKEKLKQYGVDVAQFFVEIKKNQYGEKDIEISPKDKKSTVSGVSGNIYNSAKNEAKDIDENKGIVEIELAKSGVQFLRTQSGTIYGAKFPDGTIYINTDNLNANTPIHEYGHIWQSVFPMEFKKGIELMKLSPQGRALIKKTAENPAYKGKPIEDIEAEALVTAIGNKGETIFNSNPSFFKKFKEWMSDFFKTIGDKLGIRDLSADERLDRFTKKVVGDLLGEKVLSETIDGISGTDLQSIEDSKLKSLVDTFKDNGFTYDEMIEALEENEVDYDEAQVKDAWGAGVPPVNTDTEVITTDGKTRKKALLYGAYNGESNPDMKAAIEQHDLDYIVESQDAVIKAVNDTMEANGGIEAAFAQVRKLPNKGAAAAVIYDAKLRKIQDEMATAEGAKYDELVTEMALIYKEMDEIAREAGRFSSMLHKIYQTSDLAYAYARQKELYEKATGKPIPADIELKFKELADTIKKADSRIAELEKEKKEIEDKYRDSKAKEEVDILIKEAYEKGKKDGSFGKDTVKDRKRMERAKAKIAEGLEDVMKGLGLIQMAEGTNRPSMVKGFVKMGQGLIDAGIATAENVYDKIKEEIEKAAKKSVDISSFKDDIEKAFNEPKKLKVPNSRIRELIKNGANTIEEVVDGLKEEYPDKTDREIRDGVSGYGDVKPTNDDPIEAKLRRMKRIGRYMSALEDLNANKRPSRSGQQRDELDPEERAMLKEIREKLKNLPLDDADLSKKLKTAQDAIEARTRNAIEDIQRQIDMIQSGMKPGEVLTRNTKTPITDKIQELKDELKAKKEELRMLREASKLEDTIQELKDVAAITGERNIPKKAVDDGLIQDLVQAHIEKGTPLDEVQEQVFTQLKGIFPEATDSDIRNAILRQGRFKREAKEISELRKKENELAKQLRLKEEIEKLEKGIVSISKQRGSDSAEVQDLRQRLKAKKEEAINTNVNVSIKDLERQIANVKRSKTEVLRKLAAKEFEKKVKMKKQFTNDPAWKAKHAELRKEKLERIKAKHDFDKAQEKARMAQRSKGRILYDTFIDLLGLPKALRATIDLSAPLRQGIITGLYNPKEFGRATWNMFRFIKKSNFDKFMNEIRTNEDFYVISQSGLAITDPSGKAAAQEDVFMNNIARLWGYNFPYNASERAYSGFLNAIRVEVFLKGVAHLEAQGFTFENDPEQFKALARVINNQTGRGGLGNAEAMAKELGLVFFSARMVTSRFGAIADAVRPDTPAYARKQALKGIASMIAYNATLIALGTYAIQAIKSDDDDDYIKIYRKAIRELEKHALNPVHTDFLKVKYGNTRYDFTAGYSSLIRLAFRIALGKSTRTDENGQEVTENLREKGFNSSTSGSEIAKIVKNKLSPQAKVVYSLAVNEDVDNPYKEFNWGNAVKSLVLPLSLDAAFGSDNFEWEIDEHDREGVPFINVTPKKSGDVVKKPVKYGIDQGLSGFGVSVQNY